MESGLKRRYLFLALAVCIVFSLVFAETLAAADLDHDCIGEGCPFCLVIDTVGNFLKTLKISSISLFFAALILFPAHAFQKSTGFSAYTQSPIVLKVRLAS